MTAVLLLVALVAISLFLGIRIGIGLFTRMFKALQKNRGDVLVEERGARSIAIVILLPAEQRELAEKLVAKMREKQ